MHVRIIALIGWNSMSRLRTWSRIAYFNIFIKIEIVNVVQALFYFLNVLIHAKGYLNNFLRLFNCLNFCETRVINFIWPWYMLILNFHLNLFLLLFLKDLLRFWERKSKVKKKEICHKLNNISKVLTATKLWEINAKIHKT